MRGEGGAGTSLSRKQKKKKKNVWRGVQIGTGKTTTSSFRLFPLGQRWPVALSGDHNIRNHLLPPSGKSEIRCRYTSSVFTQTTSKTALENSTGKLDISRFQLTFALINLPFIHCYTLQSLRDIFVYKFH
jgi:hypothetical protein